VGEIVDDPAVVSAQTDEEVKEKKTPILEQQLTVGSLIIALVVQAIVILIFFTVGQAIGACRRDVKSRKDLEMKTHKFDKQYPNGLDNQGSVKY